MNYLEKGSTNDMMNKNNDLFRYVHPYLCDNIHKLCTQGRIGLMPVSMNNISVIKRKLIDSKYAHIFKIQIPYAGKSLGWEVLFNPENLEFAPDFDFNDEGFPQTLNIEDLIEEIPTLVNWDIEKSGSLEAVLNEFLNLYKKHQVKELNSNNVYCRISDEYELLLSAPDISSEDVEVLIENNTVHFLISIRVELSNLPEYIQEFHDDLLLNPKEDYALLFMSFQKLDASKVNVLLQLSPRMEQLIGNSRTLHIPHYKKDESSLVEYVPLISRMLQDQVNKKAFDCQFKKEFVTALLALRCLSIIEYDSFSFNKIAFLCEVENYYVLVQVILGEEFPREKPIVKLGSLYCNNRRTKVPCERNIEYRLVPDQPADEIAKMFMNQLKKTILGFKQHLHVMTSIKNP